MITILYNPWANNGRGEKEAKEALMSVKGDKAFLSITHVRDYRDFFAKMQPEDQVILCGGDGTLQHFINDIPTGALKTQIYYYPVGSGNDFGNDIGFKKEQGPVLLNPYMEHLPMVKFHGERRLFLNNFAMGIDGYVCEKADEHRKRKKQKINYTAIALKGLLYEYKPCKAKVITEDGTYLFDNVWMAPTMKGRYFGGGMMVAPMQNRLDEAGALTLVVVHQKHRTRLLTIFPKIFKGEHVKYTDTVSFFQVRHAKVQFDRPVSVQIDGEVYRNVQEYEVFASREEEL
ncbi:Diacylglycerol kinase family enzyme [Lachnospiraceae bacterium XBB1006]|nr:Diacylglycerol kinase family enzyme [Lachnospiraceae bacterium XBB1006]